MQVQIMFWLVHRDGTDEHFRFDREFPWPGVPRPGDEVDLPISPPGDDYDPWIVEKVSWQEDGSVGLYFGKIQMPGPTDADDRYLEYLRGKATRQSAN